MNISTIRGSPLMRGEILKSKRAPLARAGTYPIVQKQAFPQWAKELALKAKPEDRGLGDIIFREIGWIGQPEFESWFLQTLGKRCKSGWSVERVNQKYPI